MTEVVDSPAFGLSAALDPALHPRAEDGKFVANVNTRLRELAPLLDSEVADPEAQTLQRKARMMIKCADNCTSDDDRRFEYLEFAHGYLSRVQEFVDLPGPGNDSASRSARAKKQLRDKHGKWIKMHAHVMVHSPFSGETFNGKVTGIDVDKNLVHVKLEGVSASIATPPENIEAVEAVLHQRGPSAPNVPPVPPPTGHQHYDTPHDQDYYDPNHDILPVDHAPSFANLDPSAQSILDNLDGDYVPEYVRTKGNHDTHYIVGHDYSRKLSWSQQGIQNKLDDNAKATATLVGVKRGTKNGKSWHAVGVFQRPNGEQYTQDLNVTDWEPDDPSLKHDKHPGNTGFAKIGPEHHKTAEPAAPQAPDQTQLPAGASEPLADWEKELLGIPTNENKTFDATSWKKIGGQGGSNPGGMYEAQDGSKWYVKVAQSDDHAHNEVLASAMYRELGIDVPEVLVGKQNGKTVIGSRLIPGAQANLESKLSDKKYKAELQQGFMSDAWLANWDVAGLVYDNVVTGEDGKPWRIDTGGSLLYRAMGTPKGNLFGNTVGEIDTLRNADMNPTSADVFSGMTDQQLKDQAQHLISVMTDAKITELVNGSGFSTQTKGKLVDTLKNRRDYIANKYGVSGANTTVTQQHPDVLKVKDGVFASSLAPGDNYYGISKHDVSGGHPDGNIYHVDNMEDFGNGIYIIHTVDGHGNSDVTEMQHDAVVWKAPIGTKPWDVDVATGDDSAPGLSQDPPPDNEPYQVGYGGVKIKVGDKVMSTTDGKAGTVVKLEPNGLYVKVQMDQDGKIKGRKSSTLKHNPVHEPAKPAEYELPPMPGQPGWDKIGRGAPVPSQPLDKHGNKLEVGDKVKYPLSHGGETDTFDGTVEEINGTEVMVHDNYEPASKTYVEAEHLEKTADATPASEAPAADAQDLSGWYAGKVLDYTLEIHADGGVNVHNDKTGTHQYFPPESTTAKAYLEGVKASPSGWSKVDPVTAPEAAPPPSTAPAVPATVDDVQKGSTVTFKSKTHGGTATGVVTSVSSSGPWMKVKVNGDSFNVHKNNVTHVDNTVAGTPAAPEPVDINKVHNDVDNALINAENHDKTWHSLDPHDLLDALKTQDGDYITVKPASGYETNLKRSDVEALVKEAGLTPPEPPTQAPSGPHPATGMYTNPNTTSTTQVNPDGSVTIHSNVAHKPDTTLPAGSEAAKTNINAVSKANSPWTKAGNTAPHPATGFYKGNEAHTSDITVHSDGSVTVHYKNNLDDSHHPAGSEEAKNVINNATSGISWTKQDGPGASKEATYADGQTAKVGDEVTTESGTTGVVVSINSLGTGVQVEEPDGFTDIHDPLTLQKIGDADSIKIGDEIQVGQAKGNVSEITQDGVYWKSSGGATYWTPNGTYTKTGATKPGGTQPAQHPNEPPQIKPVPAIETYVPKPGEKSIPGNGNVPIYKGSQVKSLNDGMTGEVVALESNGLYVKVKGADGKIRGRKASTLEVTAHPNGSKPNHADALNAASITDTNVATGEVPPELQKYVGAPKPKFPEPPPDSKSPYVPSTWLQKVKDRYSSFAAGKKLEDSNNWNRVQSVINSGDLSALQHLLSKSYLDQGLYDEAKAAIDTKKKADAAKLAQHNAETKAWQKELSLWNKANGVKGGIFDPDNFALQGMSGARDWSSNAQGTQWAKGVWPSSSYYKGNALSALQSYAGTSSSYNPDLWAMKEKSKDPTKVKQNVKNLDSAMEQAPRVPEDIIVRRGTHPNEFVALNGKRFDSYGGSDLAQIKGTIQANWGFTSTSVATKAAFSSNPVQMNIRVPKGYKAVYMHANGISSHSEYELLLDRGGHFYIHDVKNVHGHWVIEAELVPEGWPLDDSVPVLSSARFA